MLCIKDSGASEPIQAAQWCASARYHPPKVYFDAGEYRDSFGLCTIGAMLTSAEKQDQKAQ